MNAAHDACISTNLQRNPLFHTGNIILCTKVAMSNTFCIKNRVRQSFSSSAYQMRSSLIFFFIDKTCDRIQQTNLRPGNKTTRFRYNPVSTSTQRYCYAPVSHAQVLARSPGYFLKKCSSLYVSSPTKTKTHHNSSTNTWQNLRLLLKSSYMSDKGEAMRFFARPNSSRELYFRWSIASIPSGS